MKVTQDDYKILRQIFLRTLMYEAEGLWAREFLARMERAIVASTQEAEQKAEEES